MAGASGPVLTDRVLNRALLARQMLLRREHLDAEAAVQRLVGLQAQNPAPPYLALWARLEGFRHNELSELMTSGRVVRLALMRSTIHTVTASDAAAIRPLVQPVIERSFKPTPFGKDTQAADRAAIAAQARAILEREPLTWAALGASLHAEWPEIPAASLAHVARTFLPLVQVPPRGLWGESGPAAHTTLRAWTGRDLDPMPIERLAVRYLAAFGPASVADMQAWSGLTGLREVFERMRPQLRTYSSERGAELFDLPDASLPDESVSAPVRFLGEFDNLLLSHADRTRVMAPEHKGRVFTNNGIIRAILLVDGRLSGTWRQTVARDGSIALDVEVFRPLSSAERVEVESEATALCGFLAPGAAAELRLRVTD